MESIFFVADGKRSGLLQNLIQSMGLTHVSLWSYSPFPSNCLICLDGLYHHQQQPTATSATRLFIAYRHTLTYINAHHHGQLPGFAFNNCLPYIHIDLNSLLQMASTQVQIHFYQEAGVKSAAFIGCAAGEIELGMPSSEPPENLKTEVDKWFHLHVNKVLHSTSSSSINTPLELVPTFPLDGLIQEDSSHAFTKYRPRATSSLAPGTLHPKPNIFKRAVMFYHYLNSARASTHDRWPTTTQLHHMISERRRREKLNKGYKVLSALLPPRSKKDKASILSTTTNLLTTLKYQVEELTKRNQELESQIAARHKANEGANTVPQKSPSKGGAIKVEMKRRLTSDSAGFFDLRVSLRSGQCGMLEMVHEVLELVREQWHALSLQSLQSKTTKVEANHKFCLVLRLRVDEGQEFDDCGFQEAVRARMSRISNNFV